VVQACEWQVEIQVVAVRPTVRALDVGGNDVGIGRADQVQGLELAKNVADRPLGETGVANQRGVRWEGVAAVWVGVVRQADEHNRERGRVAPVGGYGGLVQRPGDRLD